MRELPTEALDWLGSDKVTGIVGDLNDGLGVSRNDRGILPSLIVDLINGSITVNDFKHELAERLQPESPEAVDRVYERVVNEIVSPISKYLSRPTKSTTPITEPPRSTQESAGQSPNVPSPQGKEVKQDKPFILHQNQEEEFQPRAEQVTLNTPVRPLFYRAPNTSDNSNASPAAEPVKARLELGVEEPAPANKPRTSRTKRPSVRRVNYSEFRTKLDDPFSAKVAAKDVDKDSGDKEDATDLRDIPI